MLKSINLLQCFRSIHNTERWYRLRGCIRIRRGLQPDIRNF